MSFQFIIETETFLAQLTLELLSAGTMGGHVSSEMVVVLEAAWTKNAGKRRFSLQDRRRRWAGLLFRCGPADDTNFLDVYTAPPLRS